MIYSDSLNRWFMVMQIGTLLKEQQIGPFMMEYESFQKEMGNALTLYDCSSLVQNCLAVKDTNEIVIIIVNLDTLPAIKTLKPIQFFRVICILNYLHKTKVNDREGSEIECASGIEAD